MRRSFKAPKQSARELLQSGGGDAPSRSELVLKESIFGALGALSASGGGLSVAQFERVVGPFPESAVASVRTHCQLDASKQVDLSGLERQLRRERSVHNAKLLSGGYKGTIVPAVPQPTGLVREQRAERARSAPPTKSRTSSVPPTSVPAPGSEALSPPPLPPTLPAETLQALRPQVVDIYNMLSHHKIDAQAAYLLLGQEGVFPNRNRDFFRAATRMEIGDVPFSEFSKALSSSASATPGALSASAAGESMGGASVPGHAAMAGDDGGGMAGSVRRAALDVFAVGAPPPPKGKLHFQTAEAKQLDSKPLRRLASTQSGEMKRLLDDSNIYRGPVTVTGSRGKSGVEVEGHRPGAAGRRHLGSTVRAEQDHGNLLDLGSDASAFIGGSGPKAAGAMQHKRHVDGSHDHRDLLNWRGAGGENNGAVWVGTEGGGVGGTGTGTGGGSSEETARLRGLGVQGMRYSKKNTGSENNILAWGPPGPVDKNTLQQKYGPVSGISGVSGVSGHSSSGAGGGAAGSAGSVSSYGAQSIAGSPSKRAPTVFVREEGQATGRKLTAHMQLYYHHTVSPFATETSAPPPPVRARSSGRTDLSEGGSSAARMCLSWDSAPHTLRRKDVAPPPPPSPSKVAGTQSSVVRNEQTARVNHGKVSSLAALLQGR